MSKIEVPLMYFTIRKWSLLSNKVLFIKEELFLLINRVSINEIMQYHDIITFYQYVDNKETSRLMFFDRLWHNKTERHRPDESRTQLLHELSRNFDVPTVDFETNRYTSSEQIVRFLNLTDNDRDTMLHSILKEVVDKMP